MRTRRLIILAAAILLLAAIMACGPAMISNERLLQTPTPNAQREARDALEAHDTGDARPNWPVQTLP